MDIRLVAVVLELYSGHGNCWKDNKAIKFGNSKVYSRRTKELEFLYCQITTHLILYVRSFACGSLFSDRNSERICWKEREKSR